MCETGSITEIFIEGRSILVDTCIARRIEMINKSCYRNLKTVGCCCGHGKYPETIIVKSKKDGKIYEFNTMTVIPRKRKFYKLDEEGICYIPEISDKQIEFLKEVEELIDENADLEVALSKL